ncbi:MAG: hypothetical protein JSV08_02395 [Acidobacteriota bacterium]|nr:MAG: hypothetical protein JSV08_02395 [Acidobacteriota bacterium]
MANALIRFGITVVALDAFLLLFAEMVLHERPYRLVQGIALAGVALLALGVVLRIVGRAGDRLRMQAANRCLKCGAAIPRGQVYCYRHTQELREGGAP